MLVGLIQAEKQGAHSFPPTYSAVYNDSLKERQQGGRARLLLV